MNGNGQLYNLEKDPAELHDLFADPDHGTIRSELVETLLTRMLRAQDPLPLPGGSYERKNHPRNYWIETGNSPR